MRDYSLNIELPEQFLVLRLHWKQVILICFPRIVLFLPREVGIILCSIVIYLIDEVFCS